MKNWNNLKNLKNLRNLKNLKKIKILKNLRNLKTHLSVDAHPRAVDEGQRRQVPEEHEHTGQRSKVTGRRT